MKNTQEKDKVYTNVLGSRLGYEFTNYEIKLDEWGESDNYCEIRNEVFLVSEIELNQRHPEMNVLKYWPYLERHTDKKVMLVQLITNPGGVSANRRKLCVFTGNKLENIFQGRFKYHFCENNFTEADIVSIQSKIADLLP